MRSWEVMERVMGRFAVSDARRLRLVDGVAGWGVNLMTENLEAALEALRSQVTEWVSGLCIMGITPILSGVIPDTVFLSIVESAPGMVLNCLFFEVGVLMMEQGGRWSCRSRDLYSSMMDVLQISDETHLLSKHQEGHGCLESCLLWSLNLESVQ